MTTGGSAELGAWIAHRALEGATEIAVLEGLCERLNVAGVRVARVAVAGNLLDPVFDARLLRWSFHEGGVEEVFARDMAETDEWLRSPFNAILQGKADVLRRRLGETYARSEFPMLDGLRAQGMTDYVIFRTRVGDETWAGAADGMVSSWTTDATGGFTDDQLALLGGIQPTLALAFMLQTTRKTARTLMTTYLGQDAAERVLAGNIVRGRADSIRAVVWFSDLAGFTRLSETIGPDGMLALLNDYAEIQVEAIETHGGHVLKFIGDAVLAIFRDDDPGTASVHALDAAVDYRRRLAALSERRQAAGLPVVDTHLALHVGEVLYGNVGSPRRLDFTVLGPAVNEASRIEALCGSLEQHVVVSSAFAEACPARSRLVSLGRYALKGVARPQEMFTLDET
jgi:adenylate cyclase